MHHARHFHVGAEILLREHFRSIPNDLLNAARLDGAHTLDTIVHVVVPSSRAVICRVGFFDMGRHVFDDKLLAVIADNSLGVLATLKRDGRPQLSNIAYTPDKGNSFLISITDDRAKTANLRRDPRASFHVTTSDFWSYVVADGHAELSAVARDPHDAAVEELIDLYRKVQGEHPDWDDYRAAMVRDRRLVIRIPAERAYGMVRG